MRAKLKRDLEIMGVIHRAGEEVTLEDRFDSFDHVTRYYLGVGYHQDVELQSGVDFEGPKGPPVSTFVGVRGGRGSAGGGDPYRSPGVPRAVPPSGPPPGVMLDLSRLPPAPAGSVHGGSCTVVAGVGGAADGPSQAGNGGPIRWTGGPRIFTPCCGSGNGYAGAGDTMTCGRCGKTFSRSAAERAAESVRP